MTIKMGRDPKSGNQRIEFETVINHDGGSSGQLVRLGKAKQSMEFFRFKSGKGGCIEWIVRMPAKQWRKRPGLDGAFVIGEDDEMLENVEEIGVTFKGKELVDYEGVFELPAQAVAFLRKMGYVVKQEDFFTNEETEAEIRNFKFINE